MKAVATDTAMLSRVADSLYWMSRYLERAEHTARVVNVNLNLTLDRTPVAAARHWGSLVASLRTPPTVVGSTSLTDVATTSTFDLANKDSIAACIAAARENARQVREQISSEMWEQLNSLFLGVRDASLDAGWTSRTYEFLSSVTQGAHLFAGITDATMTHGEGWQYIQVGRFLERAISTAAILDAHYREFLGSVDQPTEVDEYVEWVGLLRSCCAFEAYCRRYTADLRSRRIAEFLILDSEFPRSIRFAADRVETAVRAIARLSGRGGGRAERLAGRLRASLNYGQVDEIMDESLERYLESIKRQCGQIHAALAQAYITYPVETAL
jgi:uncharacterized alpha-E superfamily protein